MGRIATIIAVTYAVLGGAVVIAIALVVWHSTRGRRHDLDAKKFGERERTWFGIVVVLLVALLFAPIFFTPYGRSAEPGDLEFTVQSKQFAFVIPSTKLRAGVPVKFHLTSADVNHGFAVFNEDDEFVFQVQVMPEKTQDYVYTFKKPGRYHVVCYEYCGLGHDQMTGSFTVSR
jgi:cytochrome c oxidase subunit II